MDVTEIVGAIETMGSTTLPLIFGAMGVVIVAVWGFKRVQASMGGR